MLTTVGKLLQSKEMTISKVRVRICLYRRGQFASCMGGSRAGEDSEVITKILCTSRVRSRSCAIKWKKSHIG